MRQVTSTATGVHLHRVQAKVITHITWTTAQRDGLELHGHRQGFFSWRMGI